MNPGTAHPYVTPHPTDARAPRPRDVPIGDYGFLSDGEVCALVSPGGSVDWMCMPRFDSPSAFGKVLGRRAGSFRVGPADVAVPAARRYLPGTMILETSWGSPSGWIIVRDALLIGPWHHDNDRSRNYRRTPTTTPPNTSCCARSAVSPARCRPSWIASRCSNYGEKNVTWEYSDSAYSQATCSAEGTDLTLTLTTDLRLGFEGGQASARTLLREGDVRYIALSWNGAPPPMDYADAYSRQVWTAHHWQHWLARGNFPDHPWRGYLQRSALTLKGLTYSPTGAIIAAGTTSLPETPGGGRNYDYRYSWIRDSTFACGACILSGSTGKRSTSSPSSPTSPTVKRICRSCTGSAASTN